MDAPLELVLAISSSVVALSVLLRSFASLYQRFLEMRVSRAEADLRTEYYNTLRQRLVTDLRLAESEFVEHELPKQGLSDAFELLRSMQVLESANLPEATKPDETGKGS